MKDHESDIKQYILVSEAWYSQSALATEGEKIVDRVTFGFFSPSGGTSGEIQMRWHNIGEKWEENKKVVHATPRLECFDDGWHALAQFKDVIDAMAEVDGEDITPHQFCKILDQCGFEDATPREWR